ALLALLSLAGIVINNGIVLIDRIVLEIKEGMPPALAVIESAQKRFRPILLTTATTVVGLVPLWLGEDPMWHPMAIGLMYGLVFATVLTLALVPVLFATFYRISFADFDYVGALAADTSRRSETSA
ncbi:MAG: efflux RND transporter permease subunit, partial [Myxococcota bacterium]